MQNLSNQKSYKIYKWMLSPEAEALIHKYQSISPDPLTFHKYSELKELPVDKRIALFEQMDLINKSKRKFPGLSHLRWTAKGFEQSTSLLLAKYKASLIEKKLKELNETVILDICCGCGGDSLGFSKKIKRIGIDIDFDASLMYQNNLSDTSSCNLIWDAEIPLKAGKFCIVDPARRNEKNDTNRWDITNWVPRVQSLLRWHETIPYMVIKWGPGAEIPDVFRAWSKEYLGFKDQCLELLLWSPEWKKKAGMQATLIDWCQNETENTINPSFQCSNQMGMNHEIEASFQLTINEPGKFLYEPQKVLVRSHLFAKAGFELGLWQIDRETAYLSSNKLIQSEWFKGYQVIDWIEVKRDKLKKKLKELGWKSAQFKKRGIQLDLDQWKKTVYKKGDSKGVVIFCRIENRPMIALAKSLSE